MTKSENAKDGDATVSPFLVTLARLLKGKLKVRQRASDTERFFVFVFPRSLAYKCQEELGGGTPFQCPFPEGPCRLRVVAFLLLNFSV